MDEALLIDCSCSNASIPDFSFSSHKDRALLQTIGQNWEFCKWGRLLYTVWGIDCLPSDWQLNLALRRHGNMCLNVLISKFVETQPGVSESPHEHSKVVIYTTQGAIPAKDCSKRKSSPELPFLKVRKVLSFLEKEEGSDPSPSYLKIYLVCTDFSWGRYWSLLNHFDYSCPLLLKKNYISVCADEKPYRTTVFWHQTCKKIFLATISDNLSVLHHNSWLNDIQLSTMSSDTASGYIAHNLFFITYLEYFIQTETLTSFFCAILDHNVNLIASKMLLHSHPRGTEGNLLYTSNVNHGTGMSSTVRFGTMISENLIW